MAVTFVLIRDVYGAAYMSPPSRASFHLRSLEVQNQIFEYWPTDN